MNVPFYDLSFQHTTELREEISTDLRRLARGGMFTNGPAVAMFEEKWAEYCGRAYCVGTSSGLDALRLSLLALDIGVGDEVIVPAMTFVATWEAVTQTGATPVPVDIDADTYTLDAAEVVATVGPKTRALIPVHLYGQAAELLDLAELGIPIVEDACQAHGVRKHAKGLLAAYSFYPSKNLGAWGDAGAVVCDDSDIMRSVKSLREHGALFPYEHIEPGWTARLDTIQAAVLLRKLPLLDEWNQQRRNAAAIYDGLLADGVGDVVPPKMPVRHDTHVWHLYVIRTAQRDDLAAHLEYVADIGARSHYPQAVHRTRAYNDHDYPAGMFPNSERLAAQCLSLPLFPGITEEQQEHVVAEIRRFFDGR